MAHALLWKGLSSVSVHRSSLTRLGLAFVAGLLAASCYTGPINMRPMVFIEAPKNIDRGGSALFQVTVIEPEGQSYRLEWTTTLEPCPSPAEVQRPARWPVDGWTQTQQAQFSVGAKVTRAPFCAWAKATDKYGAAAVAAVQGEVENHAPTAVLVHSIGGTVAVSNSVVPIRTQMVFTTNKSMDSDGDELQTTAWVFVTAPTAELAWDDCTGPDATDKSKRCFTPKVAGRYVLSATVTDGFKGVDATDTFDVSPGNTPIARLELKTPLEAESYPLGTTFHLSAARSSDPDAVDVNKVEPIWPEQDELLAGAPTSAAQLGECDGAPSPMERCFRADAPGVYRVSLKVTDGTNVSTPVELSFKVDPETPPCLLETVPPASKENPAVAATIDPEKPTKTFEVVKVKDDLDPYPPSPLGDQTTFRWLVDSGDGFRPMGGDRSTFYLPTDGYHYGQEVSVRLEIFDRVTRGQPQTCTADFCETKPMCPQRVTWKVKFKL